MGTTTFVPAHRGSEIDEAIARYGRNVRNHPPVLATNEEAVHIPALPKHEVGSSIVEVNRDRELNYPQWMWRVTLPLLEKTGPSIYDLARLRRSLHPQQSYSAVNGNTMYSYARTERMLAECPGLLDVDAILEQELGSFVLDFFSINMFVGWGTRIENSDNHFFSPCIVENDTGKAVKDWVDLARYFNISRPFLLYPNH